MGARISQAEFEGFVTRGMAAQDAVDELTPAELKKKATRKIAGAKAGAGGKDFESELELVHEAYLQLNLACIHKLPVPTAPMPRSWLRDSRMGGMARILSERQGYDYAGFLPTGRAVALEAKASSARLASLPIVAPKAKGFGLKYHQLEALSQAHKWGALAVLIWRNGPDVHIVAGGLLTTIFQDYRIGTVRRIPVLHTGLVKRGELGGVRNVPDWLSLALREE